MRRSGCRSSLSDEVDAPAGAVAMVSRSSAASMLRASYSGVGSLALADDSIRFVAACAFFSSPRSAGGGLAFFMAASSAASLASSASRSFFAASLAAWAATRSAAKWRPHREQTAHAVRCPIGCARADPLLGLEPLLVVAASAHAPLLVLLPAPGLVLLGLLDLGRGRLALLRQ